MASDLSSSPDPPNAQDEKEEGELSLDDVSSSEEVPPSAHKAKTAISLRHRNPFYREVPPIEHPRCGGCYFPQHCPSWCLNKIRNSVLSRREYVQGKENRRSHKEPLVSVPKPSIPKLQEKNDDLVPISSDSDMDLVGLGKSGKINKRKKKYNKTKKKKKYRLSEENVDNVINSTELKTNNSKDINATYVYDTLNVSKKEYHKYRYDSSSHTKSSYSSTRNKSPKKHGLHSEKSTQNFIENKRKNGSKSPKRISNHHHTHSDSRKIRKKSESPETNFFDKEVNVDMLLKKVRKLETSNKTKDGSSLKDKLGKIIKYKDTPNNKRINEKPNDNEFNNDTLVINETMSKDRGESVSDSSIHRESNENNEEKRTQKTHICLDEDEEDLKLRMIALKSAVLKKHQTRLKTGRLKKKSSADSTQKQDISKLNMSRDFSPFKEVIIEANSPKISHQSRAERIIQDMELDSDIEKEKILNETENSLDSPYSPTDDITDSPCFITESEVKCIISECNNTPSQPKKDTEQDENILNKEIHILISNPMQASFHGDRNKSNNETIAPFSRGESSQSYVSQEESPYSPTDDTVYDPDLPGVYSLEKDTILESFPINDTNVNPIVDEKSPYNTLPPPPPIPLFIGSELNLLMNDFGETDIDGSPLVPTEPNIISQDGNFSHTLSFANEVDLLEKSIAESSTHSNIANSELLSSWNTDMEKRIDFEPILKNSSLPLNPLPEINSPLIRMFKPMKVNSLTKSPVLISPASVFTEKEDSPDIPSSTIIEKEQLLNVKPVQIAQEPLIDQGRIVTTDSKGSKSKTIEFKINKEISFDHCIHLQTTRIDSDIDYLEHQKNLQNRENKYVKSVSSTFEQNTPSLSKNIRNTTVDINRQEKGTRKRLILRDQERDNSSQTKELRLSKDEKNRTKTKIFKKNQFTDKNYSCQQQVRNGINYSQEYAKEVRDGTVVKNDKNEKDSNSGDIVDCNGKERTKQISYENERRSSVEEDENTLREILLASLAKRSKMLIEDQFIKNSRDIEKENFIRKDNVCNNKIQCKINQKDNISGSADIIDEIRSCNNGKSVPEIIKDANYTPANSSVAFRNESITNEVISIEINIPTVNKISKISDIKKRMGQVLTSSTILKKPIRKSNLFPASTKVLNNAKRFQNNSIQKRIAMKNALLAVQKGKKLFIKNKNSLSIKTIDQKNKPLPRESQDSLFIINSNGDSSSEDNAALEESFVPTQGCTATENDFEQSVDQFLKSVRHKQELSSTLPKSPIERTENLSVNKNISILDPSSIQGKKSNSTSVRTISDLSDSICTPQAVRHLSAEQQEEYRRLKQEIFNREQMRLKKKVVVKSTTQLRNGGDDNLGKDISESKVKNTCIISPHCADSGLNEISSIDNSKTLKNVDVLVPVEKISVCKMNESVQKIFSDNLNSPVSISQNYAEVTKEDSIKLSLVNNPNDVIQLKFDEKRPEQVNEIKDKESENLNKVEYKSCTFLSSDEKIISIISDVKNTKVEKSKNEVLEQTQSSLGITLNKNSSLLSSNHLLDSEAIENLVIQANSLKNITSEFIKDKKLNNFGYIKPVSVLPTSSLRVLTKEQINLKTSKIQEKVGFDIPLTMDDLIIISENITPDPVRIAELHDSMKNSLDDSDDDCVIISEKNTLRINNMRREEREQKKLSTTVLDILYESLYHPKSPYSSISAPTVLTQNKNLEKVVDSNGYNPASFQSKTFESENVSKINCSNVPNLEVNILNSPPDETHIENEEILKINSEVVDNIIPEKSIELRSGFNKKSSLPSFNSKECRNRVNFEGNSGDKSIEDDVLNPLTESLNSVVDLNEPQLNEVPRFSQHENRKKNNCSSSNSNSNNDTSNTSQNDREQNPIMVKNDQINPNPIESINLPANIPGKIISKDSQVILCNDNLVSSNAERHNFKKLDKSEILKMPFEKYREVVNFEINHFNYSSLDAQRNILTQSEENLVSKRHEVLDELAELSGKLRQFEIEKDVQSKLLSEVRKLKEQLHKAEKRLAVQKEILSGIQPKITISNEKIIVGRRECFRLTKICSTLGSQISGEEYKIPTTGAELYSNRIKEVAEHTIKLQNKKLKKLKGPNKPLNENRNNDEMSIHINSSRNEKLKTSDPSVLSVNALEKNFYKNKNHEDELKKLREKEKTLSQQLFLAKQKKNAPTISKNHLKNVIKDNLIKKKIPSLNKSSDFYERADTIAEKLTVDRNKNLSSSLIDNLQKESEGKHVKPYESLLKHLKWRNERTDGILCVFELNGICNDSECPYVHQSSSQR